MKTKHFLRTTFSSLLLATLCLSCSDQNDVPEITPDTISGHHFDLWVSIGSNSGMGADNTQLVKSVDGLEEQDPIDFKNHGADVTAKLYQESIIKGQYYYQIPKEKDRFGKYQIKNDKVITVAEFPFKGNTLKDRRYTHAWLDDETLVLIGSNGASNEILWIKINTEKMLIESEGVLNLPEPPAGDKFNTSGIAAYRDGQILYSFVYSNTKTHFYVAFIDAKDMSVSSVIKEDRAQFMAGTAYGELLQSKSFFTPRGDYYIACNNLLEGATSSTQQYGTLLRIKKGEMELDKTYKGYNYSKGKIVTAECLDENHALLYIQDPEHTGAAGWGNNYNCYYAILNLTTDGIQEIYYNGKVLPYSSGTFSQRSFVKDGKAYIGVNPKEGQPCIYIYDIATGNVTKGLSITSGYAFDRIVGLLDE